MNRFARWMVKHRVIVVIICLALMIPSIFGMAATRVKYDLLYYLPEDLDTIKGLLDVDVNLWKEEAKGIHEFYGKFGDKLPEELRHQLAVLEENLNK